MGRLVLVRRRGAATWLARNAPAMGRQARPVSLGRDGEGKGGFREGTDRQARAPCAQAQGRVAVASRPALARREEGCTPPPARSVQSPRRQHKVAPDPS